ncbi:MAG: hypothetical protein ACRCXE_03075, partial [Metamycoplasmataceae bacterium]
MKANLKKIALGVMTTGGLVVPLGVIASCSSSTIDYNIKSITHPILTNDDLVDDHYKELVTLEKVFTGVNADNINNYKVTMAQITNGGVYTIILETKSGYTINGKTKIYSDHFTLSMNVVSHNISNKNNPKINREDILDDKYRELSTLNKVFNGMNSGNINDFDISLQTITSDKTYTITLTAKYGYTINGTSTLVSNEITLQKENLPITKKIVTPDRILNDDVVGDNLSSINTLQKFFNLGNLTQVQLNAGIDVNLQQVDTTNYVIVLTAKNDFTINGLNNIISNSFKFEIISLSITKNTSVPIDIKPSDIEGNKFKELSLLSKLFSGPDLTQSNIDNNLIVELNPIVVGSKYTITIRAKSDYSINGESSLTSNEFTLEVNLLISPKTINDSDLVKEDIYDGNFRSFATLQKLFNIDSSITEEVINRALVITLEVVTLNDKRFVKLTANSGYTINGAATLSSQQFALPLENLIITSKTDSPSEIPREEVENDFLKSIATLEKFFDLGTLTQNKIDEALIVTLQPSSGDGNYVIQLSANNGFSINEIGTLSSRVFTLAAINLNIEKANTIPKDIHASDLEGNGYKNLSVLSKLFRGSSLTQLNINENIIVELNPIVVNKTYTITLRAKPEYSINGQPLLVSDEFTLEVNLLISPISIGDLDITKDDIFNGAFKSFATLQKLFNLDDSITEDNINEMMIITLMNINQSELSFVKLTAKEGFAINNQRYIDSNVFIVPVNYEIGIIPNPRNVRPSEINGENYKNYSFLRKLFNGVDFIEENLVNIDITIITITEGSVYQIQLTPKIGFNINGEADALISAQFSVQAVNIAISKKDNVPTDLTLVDILNQELVNSRDFLSHFFTFTAATTQEDIDEYLIVSVIPIVDRVSYKITLSPKPDVKINGRTVAFDSNTFTIFVLNLDISPRGTITEDISSTNVNETNISTLIVLQKLFIINSAIDQELINVAID